VQFKKRGRLIGRPRFFVRGATAVEGERGRNSQETFVRYAGPLRICLFVLALVAGCRPAAPPSGAGLPALLRGLSLAEARRKHPTRLIHPGPSPQPYDSAAPPDVETVTFGHQHLRAWLATPGGPGRHPAVLFAHGGFALGSGDFDDVRPFVQAGYVVMVPAWRGENGNPGSFEMYYGEVDDARDALNVLAKRPDVDRTRLFAAGHSAGGTLAMLLAETSPRLRAAAACGGFPDMLAAVTEAGRPPFAETPFQWSDPVESDLRSPARHLRDLGCPLALYYGANEDLYVGQARAMAAQAGPQGKTVTVEVFPGTDHFSALSPAIRKMIDFFNQASTGLRR
jgi:dipeptidyl aminopeptidase/acylaminoacyl peptidase